MTIETNTQNRKMLAYEIGRLIGEPVKYQGMPSMAYRVGPYTVDKEGNLTGEDFGPIHSFLVENGYIQEPMAETSKPESPEPETPEAEAPETSGTVDAEPDAPGQTDDAADAEDAENDAPDLLTITVGTANLTVRQLKNLVFMLYSKQYLIGKMTGGDLLNIPDFLEARLIEKTPETIADFLSLLDTAKEKGMTGFDFKDEKVTLTFRAFPDEPGRNMVYAMFTARILKAAREATRIFPEKQEPENEKYFARAWLLRLGYGGAAYKDERNLLLKHLKGHSAFPNDEAAEKHKEKYAEIRKEKKADGQEVERHE